MEDEAGKSALTDAERELLGAVRATSRRNRTATSEAQESRDRLQHAVRAVMACGTYFSSDVSEGRWIPESRLAPWAHDSSPLSRSNPDLAAACWSEWDSCLLQSSRLFVRSNRIVTLCWMRQWKLAAEAIQACILRRSVESVPLQHPLDDIAKRLFTSFREARTTAAVLTVARQVVAVREELGEQRFALSGYFLQLAAHLEQRIAVSQDEAKKTPGLRFALALASYRAYQQEVDPTGLMESASRRTVYKWIKEHGQVYEDDSLPSFESWRRYLNKALQLESVGRFDEA